MKYQIATYRGEIVVWCDENDENDRVIAKAKAILRRKAGPLPLGYEHYEVIR